MRQTNGESWKHKGETEEKLRWEPSGNQDQVCKALWDLMQLDCPALYIWDESMTLELVEIHAFPERQLRMF